MAKKSKKELNDDRYAYYILHRECVRRNPKYIEQYNALRKSKELGKNSFDESGLISDWGLKESLPDPKEESCLNKLQNSKPSKKVSLASDYYNDPRTSGQHIDHLTCEIFDTLKKHATDRMKGLLFLAYIPEESEYNTISTIDTRWSKEDIEDSILDMANHIVSERKQHGLKQNRNKKRLRVQERFEYLKVYDLRKSGKKFREIAEALWGEAEGDIERKARLYYQKAKEIVDKPPIRQVLIDRFQARYKKKK